MDVAHSFAATFVDELAAEGLTYVCISPGSRSAPMAMAFGRHPRIKVFTHIDERSGSFFAVGLAKATEKPVALLCTSGTAAAEFHAAVVEAFYSRTPLIVLTADRPPELIGVGANQAIEQHGLYGTAVRWSVDPGVPTEPADPEVWRQLASDVMRHARGSPAGPVHVNLPFREPLVPPVGELPVAMGEPGTPGAPTGEDLWDATELVEAIVAAERPLVVAGEMRDGAVAATHLADLGIPVMAEPASQLRATGIRGLVAHYEGLLRDSAWSWLHRPDLVVRLGATPTSKAMNQWLAESKPRTFLIDPDGEWRDPDGVATDRLRCSPTGIFESLQPIDESEWSRALIGDSVRADRAIESTLAESSMFEGHAVRAIARCLPDRANVFLGSSMPIRDADYFWPAAKPGHRFFGNRGASGIDGNVSTGLGIAATSPDLTVLVVGDLTLYHDMNGLHAVRRHGLRATIVVLDNDGGGIFHFLPQAEHSDVFEELFATPLSLDLERVAHLYGIDFVSVESKESLAPSLSRAMERDTSTLVAVRFTRDESVRGHRACWDAVANMS